MSDGERLLLAAESDSTPANRSALAAFVRKTPPPPSIEERIACALLVGGARVQWISPRAFETTACDALIGTLTGSKTAIGDLGVLCRGRQYGVSVWIFERDDGYETFYPCSVTELATLVENADDVPLVERPKPGAARDAETKRLNDEVVKDRQRAKPVGDPPAPKITYLAGSKTAPRKRVRAVVPDPPTDEDAKKKKNSLRELEKRADACYLIVPFSTATCDVYALTESEVQRLSEQGDAAKPLGAPGFRVGARVRGREKQLALCSRKEWPVYRACAMFGLDDCTIVECEMRTIRERSSAGNLRGST